MPHDAALRIIFSTDGHVRSAHFNPALIDVFRREARAFEGIYEKLG
jgi:hypothetical protein